VANDELSAEIRVTRWHPVEEAWKDAALPLPAMEAEIEAEYAAREAAEAAEAEREGHYDWHVVVHLPSRGEAAELAERLAVEGQVTRRWRYVSVGVVTEERAEELAERLASELPEGSDVRVEVNLSDVAHSPLQFLPF
jgi:muconolactone delta-isomerase